MSWRPSAAAASTAASCLRPSKLLMWPGCRASSRCACGGSGGGGGGEGAGTSSKGESKQLCRPPGSGGGGGGSGGRELVPHRAPPPFQASMAMPDVHSGYGFSIGNVAAFDMADPQAVVSPGGVGFGMPLFLGGGGRDAGHARAWPPAAHQGCVGTPPLSHTHTYTHTHTHPTPPPRPTHAPTRQTSTAVCGCCAPT